MLDRQKKEHFTQSQSDWRSYQKRLKRISVLKRISRTTLKYTAALVLIFLVVHQVVAGLNRAESSALQSVVSDSANVIEKTAAGHDPLWDKTTLQAFLERKNFINLAEKTFNVSHNGQDLKVETSLDPTLQRYIQKTLKQSTSRYIAIVVMNPESGKILSMVSYDKTNPEHNPNIDKHFPAASIFKIVTAVAAIEKCGFNQDTTFSYNGRKHTLYKSQLKQRTNKYSNKISLRDAFAQSVNPVFGKIGVHYLDATDLEKCASDFGFNRPIRFEIPVIPSFLDVSGEPYRWAEIASGFNRETKITPLHAVSIASAILNRGKLAEPSIIEKISDKSGETLYRSRISAKQIIAPETSEIMNRLMTATIANGTAKKAFRGFRRDRILSRLAIGGKTGSIDNKNHDARYDWFVGFAEEKEGTEKIVMSVFVAHEKYIGMRASEYARLAIKNYFRNYFKQQTVTHTKERKT
ncbi:penicillin-binding transpeptidase domain-containing protein [Thermodesulfobacteriota bacterium]